MICRVPYVACNFIKMYLSDRSIVTPLTRFFPATFTNLAISPQSFLIFSLNSFAMPQIIIFEPRRFLKEGGFSVRILIKLRL